MTFPNNNIVRLPVPPRRHKELWHEDGNVIIQTGPYLAYKVHSFIVSRDSTVIKDMVAAKSSPNNATGGPVHVQVDSVETSVLTSLLKLMYLPWGQDIALSDSTAGPDSVAHNLLVLRAAHQLGCDRILKALAAAIPHRRVPAVTALNIGVKCGLKDWAEMAFVEIVISNFNASLPDPEIKPALLGKVWKARQLVSKTRLDNIAHYIQHKTLPCPHYNIRMMQILPYVPRPKFESKILEGCPATMHCCRKITQELLEKVAGSEDVEWASVFGVWLQSETRST